MPTSSPPSQALNLLAPEPERGTLIVEGPDAKSWLNGILTCDVTKVSDEQGAFGLLLTKTGKIQSDLYVVELEGRLYLSVAKDLASELFRTLDRFLVMEDAELSERSSEFSWFLLFADSAGTKARALAAQFDGAAGSLNPWTDVSTLVVQRLRVPELVAEARVRGLELASPERARASRLERNLFEFGVDFSTSDNPHEAALDRRAVSWSKGCYLGQEVVCMQDMRGKVKRRLATLALETDEAPAPGTAVLFGAEQVGEVTSSAPADGVLVAARLKSPHFEQGTGLSVLEIPARIVELGSSG